jgi:hypothetical protein
MATRNAEPDGAGARSGKPGASARLRATMIAIAVAACAFSAVAAYAFSWRTALSVAIGGGIALANLWVLTRIVSSLMPAENEAPRSDAKSAWGIMAALKLVFLFGGIWLLMTKHLVDPMALLVGFGALPIGIAIGTIVRDTEPKSEDPHA